MVNVFIIDDHPAIIEGIESLLSDEPDGIRFAGSATTMQDTLEQLARFPSLHVVVLDLYMGATDPVENLQRIRELQPDSAVMIFSAETSDFWVNKMFKAGVNAYVSKGTKNELFISTIHKISDGSVVINDEMKKIIYQREQLEKSDHFSSIELEICHELAHGKSIQQIADQTDRSLSLIGKILLNLRKKTGTKSNPELIRILINRGVISSCN